MGVQPVVRSRSLRRNHQLWVVLQLAVHGATRIGEPSHLKDRTVKIQNGARHLLVGPGTILTINRPISLHRPHRHLILAHLPVCRQGKRRPTWILPTSPGTSRFRHRKQQRLRLHLRLHLHLLLRPGVLLPQTDPIGVPAMPVAGANLLFRRLLNRNRRPLPPHRKTIPGLLRPALPAAMPGVETQTVGNKVSPALHRMQSQTAGPLLRNNRHRRPRLRHKNPRPQPLAPGERKVVLAVHGGKSPRNQMTVGALLQPDNRAEAGDNLRAETPGAVTRLKHRSRNSPHQLQRLPSKRHQQQNQPLMPGR